MRIELKNIKMIKKTDDILSAPFSGELFINGKKVATAVREKDKTNYTFEKRDSDLIKRAGRFLAQEELKRTGHKVQSGEALLTDLIRSLAITHFAIIDEIAQREEKFLSQMEKSILIGTSSKDYYSMPIYRSISNLGRIESGIEFLKDWFQQYFIPKIKPGEKVLNTNISPSLLGELMQTPIASLKPKGKGAPRAASKGQRRNSR